MSGPDPPPGDGAQLPQGSPSGLCGSCAHQRLIRNTRGSEFSMCDRARSDPDYPRYPRHPVLTCAGHEERAEDESAPEGPR